MQSLFGDKERIELLRKIAAKPFYDARTDFEMALIEDCLVKEGYVKILSRYAIPEYFTCEITPLGKVSIERGGYVKMEQAINIFISHSSKDTDLVIKFLRLLRSAFLIPSEEIRCTSVDGFKLPIGIKTSEKLKHEVIDSKLFIGMITKNSLASLYTCFELGARWATSKPFLPIIFDKEGVGLLKAPLTEINAAVANDKNSVLQLLSQIGEKLNIKQENITVFNNDLDEFIDYVNNTPNIYKGIDEKCACEIIKENTQESNKHVEEPDTEIKLSDFDIELLKIWANGSGTFQRVDYSRNEIDFFLSGKKFSANNVKEIAQWNSFFEKLKNYHFIEIVDYNKSNEPIYRLTQKAYDYVKNLDK